MVIVSEESDFRELSIMKKIFSLLVGALLVYSCTPKVELGTPFQAGQQVSLIAHMPNTNSGASQLPSKQRVSGLDTGTHINLTWDEGDVVLVTVDGQTAEFTLESGAGSSTGTFTGTMPANGTTYSVQYPVSEPDLSNQTYVENGFGKGLLKLMTTNGTIDEGFTLAAQHSLFGLQLTGDQAIGNIVLTNPANSMTYTLNCAGVTLTSAEQLFYFVVPAETWASGFTVDVYGSDNTTKIKTLTKSSSVTFTAGGAMVMPTQEVKRVGAFSVSATKKVIFSPGNLQYTQSTDTWSFAENQYDYIGATNVVTKPIGGGWNTVVLGDKIDMFGWSGSTGSAPFGVSDLQISSGYTGDFVDWGTNTIGDYAPNTWRTLTAYEWEYLTHTSSYASGRANAENLMGVAQVNGVNGMILLPDNWSCPTGVTFISGFASTYDHQTITVEDWLKLEDAGAVFLPAAGVRKGHNIYNSQITCLYWSSTPSRNNSAGRFSCYYGDAVGIAYEGVFNAFSVRLVQDL